MKGRALLVSGGALLVAAALALIAVERVPEGSVRLRLRDGEVAAVLEPGLHLRRPGSRVTYRTPPQEVRLTLPLTLPEGSSVDLEAEGTVRLHPGEAARLWRSTGEESVAAAADRLLGEAAARLAPDASAALLAGELDDRAAQAGREALEGAGLAVEELTVRSGELATGLAAAAEREAVRREIRPTGERVLLVGVDGADWEIMEPLIETGRLPTFARLRAEGAWGDLRSEQPMLSPLLWNTMATGRSPDEHGILDFLMKDPGTGKKVPISSRFRRVRALWNILSEYGDSSTFIAWFVTWPAEEVRGTIVSDRFSYSLFADAGPESGEGIVHPPGLLDDLEALRVRPEDVGYEEVARYLDVSREEFEAAWREARSDPEQLYENRVNHFREILASMDTYHRVALDLLRREQPPLFSVYYQGVDEVGHLFGHYAPPPLHWVPEEDRRRFGRAVAAYYELQDRQLAELLEAAGPGTTLMLVSDHGFRSGAARPRHDPADWTGKAAAWHRPYGVVLLWGPSVQSARLQGATLYEIAPTILYLLGYPIPRDWKGRPLLEAFRPPFRARNQVARIESYEVEPHAPAPPDGATGGGTDPQLLAKLRSLGYIGAGPAEEEAAGSGAGVETASYHVNLAAVHLARGEFEEAVGEYREALALHPEYPEALRGLALAYGALGRTETAYALTLQAAEGFAAEQGGFLLQGVLLAKELERLRGYREWLAAHPGLEGLAEYRLAWALSLTWDGDEQEAEAWYRRALEVEPAYRLALDSLVPRLLSEHRYREAEEVLGAALAANPSSPVALRHKASLHAARGELGKVRESYERALEQRPDDPELLAGLGAVLARLGRYREAEDRLRQAYRIRPEQYEVLLQLGAVLGKSNRPREALEFLRKAERIEPDDPRVLNALGVAHLQAGDPGGALRPLRRSLEVAPEQPEIAALVERLEGSSP